MSLMIDVPYLYRTPILQERRGSFWGSQAGVTPTMMLTVYPKEGKGTKKAHQTLMKMLQQ